MANDKHEQIRTRAYQIWEEEGRPHGRDHHHWVRAEQESGADAPEGQSTEPSPTDHPGMMGDGTEEQNLNQPGKPDARITKDEVEAAFASKTSR